MPDHQPKTLRVLLPDGSEHEHPQVTACYSEDGRLLWGSKPRSSTGGYAKGGWDSFTLVPGNPPDVDERLMGHLRDLGNDYGPLGVAIAAASLTDAQALAQHLPAAAQAGPPGCTSTHPITEVRCALTVTHVGVHTSTMGNRWEAQ